MDSDWGNSVRGASAERPQEEFIAPGSAFERLQKLCSLVFFAIPCGRLLAGGVFWASQRGSSAAFHAAKVVASVSGA